MSTRFRVLDAEISLSGAPEVVGPIVAAYARFRAGDETNGHDAGRAAVARVDGEPVPLVAGLDEELCVYERFLAAIYRKLGVHALLHGACLADARGRALLVAGPAGHGKSSLALELAARGLGFLSDDFCPVDLDRRTAAPYPRAVALRTTGDAPVPEPFRSAAARPGTPRLLGKAVLDVESLLGPRAVVRTPLPLGTVVLLEAAPGAVLPERTCVRVLVRGAERVRLAEACEALAGVRLAGLGGWGEIGELVLELDHAAQPTAALGALLDDPSVVLAERLSERLPTFDAPPAVRELPRSEAALVLARELLNRRTQARFLRERYAGRLAPLLLDLAGALADARCFALVPGPLAATADCIVRLAAENA